MNKNWIAIGSFTCGILLSPLSQANISKEIKADRNEAQTKEVANRETEKPTQVVFEKTRIPYTEIEEAAVEYDQALTLINKGKEADSIPVLKSVLKKTPMYHPARLQLVKLLKKDGLYFDVEKLLSEGLKLDDRHPEYLKHMAGILQEKNEHKQALELLLQIPKDEQFTKEYRSMLALSYFNEGIYSSSAKYYTSLIREEERNSKWWLGLAVSQDALERNKDAIKSFEQVRRLGKQQPEVLKYVSERIDALNANAQSS